LQSLQLPPKSEILFSAVTMEGMVQIVRHHDLIPVPVDLDLRSLAPKLEALEHAITPRTKMIVVAHLFGSRFPLDPILDVARKNNLILVEDCAQAYVGPDDTGDPRADVSLFSFGPVKTATALGGALLRVRDSKVRDQMRSLQAGYPVQTAWSYPVIKVAIIKGLSTRPIYSCFLWLCRAIGCDYDRIANRSTLCYRGPDFVRRIRRQPAAPLLAVLQRQLRRFTPRTVAARTAKGALLRELLGDQIDCPGRGQTQHSRWLFPVLVDDPDRWIDALRRRGFDATRGGSLCVVGPPAERSDLAPVEARDLLSRVFFLPCYPEITDAALHRLAGVFHVGTAPLPSCAHVNRPKLRVAQP